MLKFKNNGENGGIVRVNLHGRFTSEYVPEVEKILASNGDNPTKIALDLKNVTFVDRAAMEFLRGARSRQIRIENIPSYVNRWMKQETGNGSSS